MFLPGMKFLGRAVTALSFAIASISLSAAETKVVTLGTGTPVPIPERSGPATAVVVDGNAYLFDFGPGVVRQAAAMAPRWGGDIEALHPGNLNVAFVTHLHSDHTAGFADLLFTGWSGGHRNQPLKVFGPDGIDKLVDGTLSAYDTDIRYRLYGLEETNDRGWRVQSSTVEEGLVYKDKFVKVYAIPVVHGSWPNAFGYKIETKDKKTIVISGDASPSEKLLEASRNADFLVHEVYCHYGFENFKNLNEQRRRYHKGNHTSTKELAEIANEAKPKTLIMTHLLPFGCSNDQVLEEVTSEYEGTVFLANDRDVFE